jgi:hypothetical protein
LRSAWLSLFRSFRLGLSATTVESYTFSGIP